MITLRLTTLQREELLHKMGIIESEDDLLESYDITAEEARTLTLKVELPITVLSAKEAVVIEGEVENLLEIVRDNMDSASDDDVPRMRGYISSMVGLLAKLG